MIVVVITFAFSLSVDLTPARAGTILAADLCGQGSAPDYGFTYDLQQIHWTVDWQSHVSENTVTEVKIWTVPIDVLLCSVYKILD